jgi:hypothetical protein
LAITLRMRGAAVFCRVPLKPIDTFFFVNICSREQESKQPTCPTQPLLVFTVWDLFGIVIP